MLLTALIFRPGAAKTRGVEQTLSRVRPWFESDDWQAEADRRGLPARDRALVGSDRRDGYLVIEDGGSPRDDRTLTRKSQVTHDYFADAVPFTPMFSHRSAGRYLVRRVCDIRTNRWVGPSLDGTPVVFPDAGGGLRAVRPVAGLEGAVTRALAAHANLPTSPMHSARLVARDVLSRLRR